MSMVAHASCLHSMIMRRIGRLDDAAADAALALEFKLATSPPLAVAWAAALCIEALTRLGRLDEADAVAAAAAAVSHPPAGSTRLPSCRHGAGCGSRRAATPRRWTICSPRARAGAHSASTIPPPRPGAPPRPPRRPRWGDPQEAAALAAEQLALARRVGTPATLGAALRAHAAAVPGQAGEVAGRGGRPAGNRPRRDTSWRSRWPTWAPSCAGRDGAPTPVARCAAPWTSRSAPAPRRWPSGPGGSCSRPEPGPGAPPSPARTRSPAPNGGSPASPPTACPTGRSPSTCSSPSPPSRPTSGTPSRSSASPPGPTCPRSWPASRRYRPGCRR